MNKTVSLEVRKRQTFSGPGHLAVMFSSIITIGSFLVIAAALI